MVLMLVVATADTGAAVQVGRPGERRPCGGPAHASIGLYAFSQSKAINRVAYVSGWCRERCSCVIYARVWYRHVPNRRTDPDR